MKLISVLLYLIAFGFAIILGLVAAQLFRVRLLTGIAIGWFTVVLIFILWLGVAWLKTRKK